MTFSRTSLDLELPEQKRPSYMPYVDGLRAIAVLSVIAYHLSPNWLPGGFFGVDIFFVISGFIVSASVKGLRASGPASLAVAFYARRVLRIAPALIVMLLVTTMATAVLIPEAWLSDSIQRTGIFAFFGLSNIVLRDTANDYFSLHSGFNPYTHTWSLGIEEQFYLVFPILFSIWSFTSRFRRISTILFLAALVLSIYFSLKIGTSDPNGAFYLIFSRFWELAAGVILYQVLSLRGWAFDGTKYAAPTWFRWGALGAFLLVVVSLVHPQLGAVPAPGSILVVVGTLGLLLFCHGTSTKNPILKMLELRPVVFVGTISYSLYLWHWPVFVLFRWTVGLDTSLGRIAAFIVSFALALASYFVVERTIRNLRVAKRSPKIIVVLVGISMIAGSAWLATQINSHQPSISISTVSTHGLDWYPIGSWTDPRFPSCEVQQSVASVSSDTVTTYSRGGCSLPVRGPDIYVIGDSHVGSYQPEVFSYVLRTGATATISYVPGCGVLSFTITEEEEPCAGYRQAAIDDILSRLKPGQVVFLPSLRLPRFTEQDGSVSTSTVLAEMFNPAAADARARGTVFAATFLHAVTAKGASVILEGVPPIFREAPFRCADWYDRSNPVCKYGPTISRHLLLRLRQPVMKIFEKLSSQIPHVSIWDPFPILCPATQESCNAFKSGKPLFFDGDHLSGYSSVLLGPSFDLAIIHASRS